MYRKITSEKINNYLVREVSHLIGRKRKKMGRLYKQRDKKSKQASKIKAKTSPCADQDCKHYYNCSCPKQNSK